MALISSGSGETTLWMNDLGSAATSCTKVGIARP